jgi:hypothetical protein
MTRFQRRQRPVASILLSLAFVGAWWDPSFGQSGPVARLAQSAQTPRIYDLNRGTEPPPDVMNGVPPANPEAPPSVAPGADESQDYFSRAIAGTAPTTGIAPANSTLGAGGAYIDNAIPRSQFRTRYDVAGGVNHPDRAEFFWPRFGPVLPVGRLSFQEVSNYVEYAPTSRFSAFFDLPARFIHIPNKPGLPAQNFGGFSDLTLGAKYAFVARPDAFYTFQFKVTAPTGNAQRGLGNGHPSIEPGLLLFRQVSERGFLIGQFSDWIPAGGPGFQPASFPGTARNFAGNVLNYGVGGFFNAVQMEHFRVAPVAEFVGWTVLSGRTSVGPDTQIDSESAAGQTIVNAKIGARIGIGDYLRPGGASPLNDRVSLYAGYGRSLTGDVIYKNIFRLELVVFF